MLPLHPPLPPFIALLQLSLCLKLLTPLLLLYPILQRPFLPKALACSPKSLPTLPVWLRYDLYRLSAKVFIYMWRGR